MSDLSPQAGGSTAEHLDGDPLAILRRWLGEAEAGGEPMASTMQLATTDGGSPHARTVVVTTVTDAGLTFHSSTPTTKSRDLRANARAAGVFHWPTAGRQVVLTGAVQELSAAESDAAYRTRPRQLQLIAWVYEELGQELAGPAYEVSAARIQERMDAAAALDPASLERPPSWTTFRIVPDRIDFWQAGTEVVAPTKTRFLRGSPGNAAAWSRTEALP